MKSVESRMQLVGLDGGRKGWSVSVPSRRKRVVGESGVVGYASVLPVLSDASTGRFRRVWRKSKETVNNNTPKGEKESSVKMFLAMNVLGWAYGSTHDEAVNALAHSTDNLSVEKQKEKYLLRVFETPVKHDGIQFYCPSFPKGTRYSLIEDNMKDWPSDQSWPIQLEA